jgi:glycosyl hydrolase, family 25
MWLSPLYSLKTLCLVGCFSFIGLSAHAERKHRGAPSKEPSDRIMPDMMPVQSKKNVQSSVQMMQVSRGISRVNTKFREGIDVSRYQGVIDWGRVGTEANVSFVYIKATEGSSLVDPTYAYNIANARQAGLSVGSYHFYRPRASVDEQVANMTSVVQKADQDLVPLIDIETTGGVSDDKFVSDLQEFVDRIATYYGKKPILYTYQNFYNRHLVGTFRGYHWVMAKYKDEAPMLTDNVDYMMWQYTQTGRLPGIRGNVDRIRIMGNHSLAVLEM